MAPPTAWVWQEQCWRITELKPLRQSATGTDACAKAIRKFFPRNFPGGELLLMSLESEQSPYAAVNLVTGLRFGGLKDG